jgi:hypothetical protein
VPDGSAPGRAVERCSRRSVAAGTVTVAAALTAGASTTSSWPATYGCAGAFSRSNDSCARPGRAAAVPGWPAPSGGIIRYSTCEWVRFQSWATPFEYTVAVSPFSSRRFR